jgi:hypothetical protein
MEARKIYFSSYAFWPPAVFLPLPWWPAQSRIVLYAPVRNFPFYLTYVNVVLTDDELQNSKNPSNRTSNWTLRRRISPYIIKHLFQWGRKQVVLLDKVVSANCLHGVLQQKNKEENTRHFTLLKNW